MSVARLFIITLAFGGLVGVIATLNPVAEAGPGVIDPEASAAFADAALVPEDVTLFVHVTDGAGLRANLARRPLARLVTSVLEDSEFARAWRRIAAQSGVGEARFFDLWLGRRVTLVARPVRDEPGVETGRLDWALFTEVDPATAEATLKRLVPRRLSPRHDFPVGDLPDHALLFALDGDRWIVGPSPSGRLFDEVLERLAADDPGKVPGRLSEHPALIKTRRLGGTTAAIFIRHGQTLGGWSVLAADARGETIELRHRAHFDNAVFTRGITNHRWDRSILRAVEDAALLAIVEPTDIGGSRLEIMLEQILGLPLLGGQLEGSVGECRILTVGEVEGRQEPPRADLLVPTGAVAVKMNKPLPREKLDRQILDVTRAINERRVDHRIKDVPTIHELRAGAPRRIMLDSVLIGAIADPDDALPFLRSVSLNWDVAQGPAGCFCVIASHPAQLELMRTALENAKPGPPEMGRWAAAGTLDGRRVGTHLRSFVDRPALLVAHPEDAEAFRATVLTLSRLADGVKRCRWELRRPTEKSMTLDVHITLSAPDSAERE